MSSLFSHVISSQSALRQSAGCIRRYVVTGILLIAGLTHGKAQSKESALSPAPNRQDTVNILQQCLDLPLTQDYYIWQANTKVKQVYIMQLNVAFSPELSLSKSGKPVLIRSRAEIHSQKAEVFLAFRSFTITGDDASVTFTLHSNCLATPKVEEVSVQLHRTGAIWSIVKKQIHQLV